MKMKEINTTAIGKVSSSQCWKILQQDSNSFLLDVRTPEEWQETGITDLSAANKEVKLLSWIFFTPYIHHNDHFLSQLNDIFPNKDVTLFFMCKSGGRSAQASEAAFSNGYKKIYNVEDGFIGNNFDENLKELNTNGWINSNLPRRAL